MVERAAVVIGDEARLEQVVLNLMTNAVHHAPERDWIVVRLRRLDDCYEVQVHDEGPGIPAYEQEGIFRSVQLGCGSTSGRVGTRLFIARVLFNEHGGAIELASSAETGTTFM